MPLTGSSKPRPTKSCSECRRRKQKCIPTKEGPCLSCLRRYPPVECTGLPKPRVEYTIAGLVDRRNSSSQESIIPHCSGTPTSDEEPSFPKPGLVLDGLAVVFSSPRAVGGIITAMNSLGSAPITATIRNAELFQFFLQFVVPNLVSVDGKSQLILFTKEILLWMIQSPLMPNIAILMASATQALERGMEPKTNTETLVIKSRVLSLVNEFLCQDFKLIGSEAIRAVIHLAVMEWFWGGQVGIWAHMKGVKEMVKLRDGLSNIQDPILEQVLILTDYELACCFERDLYLQDPHPSIISPQPTPDEIPGVPPSQSISVMTPLFPSNQTFQQSGDSMKLSLAAVDMLDDIRFLTLSITVSPTPSSTSKIQSTASWLHIRLQDLPHPRITSTSSEADVVTDTIRIASLAYTSAIMNLNPFSQSLKKHMIRDIDRNLAAVPMARWKEIPGLFLWILLVMCPSSHDDVRGRWLRRKMAVAGMAIGLEEFSLGIMYLQAFWKVQRWIAREMELDLGVKNSSILYE